MFLVALHGRGAQRKSEKKRCVREPSFLWQEGEDEVQIHAESGVGDGLSVDHGEIGSD